MICKYCEHDIKDPLLQTTCLCGRVWCCMFCAKKHEFIHDTEVNASLCRYCRPPYHVSDYCFWCSQLCNPATKDHVIPKHMGGKRTVSACETCNQERSIISSLYQNVVYQGAKDWNQDWRPLLKKYRNLIEIKLQGTEQLICFKEIDKILLDIEAPPKKLYFSYKL